MFQTNVVQKIETHILCPTTFPKIVPCIRQHGKMQYIHTDHKLKYNAAYALCMLDK
jgi:hypothetical protein